MPTYASALMSFVTLSLLIVSAIRTQQSVASILVLGTRLIRDELAPQAMKWTGLAVVLSLFAILTLEPVKLRFRQLIFDEGVIAEPVVVNDLKVGQPFQGEITLRNLGPSAVTLVGSKSSCTCMSVNFQRTMLAGKSSVKKRFQIVPASAGRVHQRLIFYVDVKRQHCVAVDIVGFAKERSDEIEKENSELF